MGRDIIVIGGSAGAIEALRRLVGTLPADLPASLFVVVHIPASGPSVLAAILDAAGPLRAEIATDGAPFVPGRIYVAPPDHHLLVRSDTMALVRGPRENRHRPAVDPLFRSAAKAHGDRVVAVVLSGNRDDGAAGLQVVRAHGGVAVVQDPADASVASMPSAALARAGADHCVPLCDMPPLLSRLSRESPPGKEETGVSHPDPVERGPQHYPGPPSGLTCPECHGALWAREGDASYRCRVGHAYSEGSLRAAQEDALEAALWTALRIVEERIALLQRMLAHTVERHLPLLDGMHEREIADLRLQEDLLRAALLPGSKGRFA